MIVFRQRPVVSERPVHLVGAPPELVGDLRDFDASQHHLSPKMTTLPKFLSAANLSHRQDPTLSANKLQGAMLGSAYAWRVDVLDLAPLPQGLRLKLLRLYAGDSVQSVATRWGMSADYVYRVERGVAEASPLEVKDVEERASQVSEAYAARRGDDQPRPPHHDGNGDGGRSGVAEAAQLPPKHRASRSKRRRSSS